MNLINLISLLYFVSPHPQLYHFIIKTIFKFNIEFLGNSEYFFKSYIYSKVKENPIPQFLLLKTFFSFDFSGVYVFSKSVLMTPKTDKAYSKIIVNDGINVIDANP